jgi:hypothetical protein
VQVQLLKAASSALRVTVAATNREFGEQATAHQLRVESFEMSAASSRWTCDDDALVGVRFANDPGRRGSYLGCPSR